MDELMMQNAKCKVRIVGLSHPPKSINFDLLARSILKPIEGYGSLLEFSTGSEKGKGRARGKYSVCRMLTAAGTACRGTYLLYDTLSIASHSICKDLACDALLCFYILHLMAIFSMIRLTRVER